MTPTMEEYERVLDFPNNSRKIYLRRKFEDTTSEVVNLLGLRLVLFPSEIGVISLEAANVFVEYEYDRINPSSAILAETMLSLNHCRMHGKGSMRCCSPMLYLWIVSHIETLRDIFNNFWWFDL